MELVRFSYTQLVTFPFSHVGPKCLQGLQREHKMECVQYKHIYIIHVACVVDGIHVQTEAHSAQRLCCDNVTCRQRRTLHSGCVATMSRAYRDALCTAAVLRQCHVQTEAHSAQRLCCDNVTCRQRRTLHSGCLVDGVTCRQRHTLQSGCLVDGVTRRHSWILHSGCVVDGVTRRHRWILHSGCVVDDVHV